MFIFSCYAGGLRFFDVFELRWEHINLADKRLSKKIRKSKRLHNFKLPEQAIDILINYHTPEKEDGDYVFGLLPKVHNYTEEELYKQKMYKDRYANKRLKKIGAELELPFDMTFHISRHTFATLALRLGMRVEYVSKILDHTDIQTTQIYAKIVNSELDKAMESVFK